MPRRTARVGAFAFALVLLVVTPASAVITALTPLSGMLQESQFILTATVERIDADKPAVIMTVEEGLKGKAPFRKLAVNLKGDSEAAKHKQTPQLLKRLAPKLPLVLFVAQRDKDFVAFAFTNGTWFQLTGTDDGGTVRWAFTHCEPYLRRTYAGNTADLKQVVTDALAGKKKPPEVNPKEKPGLGPEAETGEKPKDNERGAARPAAGGPPFAVIPTVVIGPVLMALAALFPAVFGGLTLVFRRWTAALAVASLNSTLYLAWDWANAYLVGSWWGTPPALWLTMTAVTLLGTLWAWRRHAGRLTAAPQSGPATPAAPQAGGPRLAVIGAAQRAPTAAPAAPPPAPIARFEVPGLGEVLTLAVLGAACVAAVAYWLPRPLRAVSLFDKTLLFFASGVWAAAAYLVYQRYVVARRPDPRPGLPAEGVFLGAMLLAASGLATTLGGGATAGPVAVSEGGETPAALSVGNEGVARLVTKAVLFRPAEPSWVASSPTLAGDRVYVGAVHGQAFTSGAVYCLEADGRVRWAFNNGGKMKDVFSSPCVSGGRVYVGEGFHQHVGCKLYCLDADTGAKVWEVQTASHTESSPCVADGRVYFGAGDDGLYCLDAATGAKVWHLNAGLHVDANPLVSSGRLYCGSGVGDTYKETCVFCLDAATGKELWRVPTELPVWGGLALEGEQVYAATGNGNFVASDETRPAGALLCLDAATGARRWQFDVGDGVHVKVAADRAQVYFASRDGHCYCVGRLDGRLRWKRDLGSPVVASPALAGCTCCGVTTSVYAAASAGRVCCLDAATGRVDWTFDVAKDSGSPPEATNLFSSPVGDVRRDGGADRRRVYLGCGLENNSKGALYCLEDVYAGPTP
jgi:outer membrane protein assembly factor BamB